MAIFNGSAETMNLLKPNIMRALEAAEWASVVLEPANVEGVGLVRHFITIEYYLRDPKTLAEVFRKEEAK